MSRCIEEGRKAGIAEGREAGIEEGRKAGAQVHRLFNISKSLEILDDVENHRSKSMKTIAIVFKAIDSKNLDVCTTLLFFQSLPSDACKSDK